MSQTAYQDLGRLMVTVCRLHHTRADQSVENLGLFRGQAFLLLTLADSEGMTHSEIAERLRVSPAAVTKVIKRMEESDYVQRQPDPADERVSRVYLQPAGRSLIAEIHRAFASVNRATFEGLEETDLEQLRRLLTHMQESLRQFRP